MANFVGDDVGKQKVLNPAGQSLNWINILQNYLELSIKLVDMD